jgi:VIT1/CCC1 family predicted Fe2+/Mn2+ transporter
MFEALFRIVAQKSGVRQILLGLLAAGIMFGIGRLIGAAAG